MLFKTKRRVGRCTPLVALALGAVLFGGCGSSSEKNGNSADEETTGTATQAVTVTSSNVASSAMSLSYDIPAATDATKIAIAASGTLFLGNYVTVKDTAGTPALVTSLGTGWSSFQTDVVTGDLWNQGSLFMAERAKVQGTLHLGGTISPQNNAGATTVVSGTFATETTTRTVKFPTVLSAGKTFENDSVNEKTLTPGAYAFANVRPQNKVILKSGDYYFDNLIFEADSVLILDQSNGPVNMYVRNSLTYKPLIEVRHGGAPNFLLAYFGTYDVSVERPLVGALIAPNANVLVARTDKAHRGSIVGKNVTIQANAVFTYVPYAGWLIGDIQVSKASVCANEPVTITVVPNAAGTGETPTVTISGVPGATRTMQFPGHVGPRNITVSAEASDGTISVQSVAVSVVSCSSTNTYPAIGYGPNPYHENTVDILIRNAKVLGRTSPQYIWNFGDGTSATTTAPYASHDYSQALGRDTEFNNFNVTVTVRQSGYADLVSTKTVTAVNRYAYSKKRGTLQPPAVYEHTLTTSSSTLTANVSVKNLESEPVVFTQKLTELVPCDGTVEPATQLVTTSIQVGANATVGIPISVPAASVGSSICGVNVYFKGKGSTSKLNAVVATSFTAKERPRTAISSAAKQAVLTQIVNQNLLANPDTITDEDIYRLAAEGKITMPTADATLYDGEPAAQGDRCEPGDVSDDLLLSCKAAVNADGSPKYDGTVPYLANALRGDVILSHACGMVGKLLSNVQPPQVYTHTGIMTRNLTRVKHATAVEGRYSAYDNLVGWIDNGSDGIKEDVLKYGWPGVVEQSIEGAFVGQKMKDPYGVEYNVSGFHGMPTMCAQDTVAIGPGLLRSPIASGNAGRSALLGAAQIAENSTTGGNYRMYGYSRADLAAASLTPASAVWADNTPGVMCSSYVWTAFKQTGATLEGNALEINDWKAEQSSVADGLYHYTVTERYAAAIALRDEIVNLVEENSFWSGNGSTDAADDMSHQVVNCFAHDECQVDNSENDAWEDDPSQLGYGETVAPDDVQHWDIFEPTILPLVYMQGMNNRVYTWQPSAGTGVLEVTVLLPNGAPAAGAALTLGGVSAYADGNGQYTFGPVLGGDYELTGSYVVNGGYAYQAALPIYIQPEVVTTATFALRRDESLRTVSISATLIIHEDDNWPYDSETKTVTINESVNLNPDNLTDSKSNSGCVGGEARGEWEMNFSLRPLENYAVETVINLDLYEGTTCSNDDHDGSNSYTFVVPNETWYNFFLTAQNDAGDWTSLEGSILNTGMNY